MAMAEMIWESEVSRGLPRRAVLIWATVAPGHAGGALGRLAVLPARLGFNRQSQPQHVYPHRHRHGTAYGYSVIATFFPDLFPDAFRAHGGESAVYFEAAAVITTLVLLGQVLELRARSQTSSAIKALLGLAPKTARRLREDGDGRRHPAGARPAGRPTPRPPWGEDARGRHGPSKETSAVDESMVTGEPVPVEKDLRAAASPAGRSTAPAAWSCGPSASGARRSWRRSCAW